MKYNFSTAHKYKILFLICSNVLSGCCRLLHDTLHKKKS